MPRQSKDSADLPGGASRGLGLLKHRLVTRRRELVERLHAVEHDLERVGDPASAGWSERPAQRSNDEVLQAIGEADAHELAAIDAALRRLERGASGSAHGAGG